MTDLPDFHFKQVFYNLSPARLVEESLRRGQGMLSERGALGILTGKYTGRSPKDKFIVEEKTTRREIWWGDVNRSVQPETFNRLRDRMARYLAEREVFMFDGFCGADPQLRLPVRFINEFAWQNLFVHQLFIRPAGEELKQHKPEFTVICAPGVHADPGEDVMLSEAFILINFEEKLVLIGGTHYAGELKKSIFTVMNFLMPRRGVLPMHCSANVGKGGDVALFFGLSGTGKTTLSADPARSLVGDDEHGWSKRGIFNFEGGCYAKCIRLSQQTEPQIWEAVRFGSVLENVVIDQDSRSPDFDSDRYTENTRAAYPIDHIPGAAIPGVAGHPSVIIFLTADAFGVLPPISKLGYQQAMVHFLIGYTSKLAGTERGVADPQATFSTCFGAPFLPLKPSVYAKMLGERIKKHNSRVYLINTGWTGGKYGEGKRIPLPCTRAMVTAAITGQLDDSGFRKDPIFGLMVPERVPDVQDGILIPRNTWKNGASFDDKARELAGRFEEKHRQFRESSELELHNVEVE